MRRLATDLATARGALDVGFVVTVTPKARSIELRVRKDGEKIEAKSSAKPLEIEANAEVEVVIADVATVHVRGGRRETQEKARSLENRWSQEVAAPSSPPVDHPTFAGLGAKIAEAQELDTGIKTKDVDLESLRARIAALAGAAAALREATDRVAACRASLGEVGLDTLAGDLKALGADATVGLRKRRQQLSREAEDGRRIASQAANARTLADERTRHSKMAVDAAIVARDACADIFPRRE